jgi:hypothetical protein
LVEEILAVVITEILCSDDSVEVGLEEFLNKVDLVERFVRGWLNDVEYRDDLGVSEILCHLFLPASPEYPRVHPSSASASYKVKVAGLTFSLTPAWAKYFNNLSSRNVLRANIECSNGAIFLMATLVPVCRCVAETTTPYAPSPITSTT